MKLIHDCVRDVMLYVEKNLKYDNIINTENIFHDLSKYSLDDINYTCKKLDEAGYLKTELMVIGYNYVNEITYQGHLFLDTIRDDGIWKEIKSRISKLASVSLPIIQQVGAQLINNKLGI